MRNMYVKKPADELLIEEALAADARGDRILAARLRSGAERVRMEIDRERARATIGPDELDATG